MRHAHLILVATAATGLLSVAALAQNPPESKGRYTMTPVDGGLMRLDTETGAVALCTRKAETWVCDAVKDGTRPNDDVARLEAENKALKDKLKALEDLAATFPPEPGTGGAPPPGGVTKLPTEEDVDKAFDYVEGMFKKLRDRIKKLEEPNNEAKPGGSGAL